ncbi:MAG: ribonuclease P protein component [Actinobacteria bacterium]|nr:ribonuclease P protein component [Actinomycetota bacterium]
MAAATSATAASWWASEPSAAAPRPAPPGRIRDRATFAELRRRGRRTRAGVLTLTWVPGEPPARVAYAVSRAVGSAVERNRVRRRLRALVAEAAAQLRPGAYLVGTAPRAARSSYQGLRDDLRRALAQLGHGE